VTVPATKAKALRSALLTLIQANTTVAADKTIYVIYDEPLQTTYVDIISVGAVKQTEDPYAHTGDRGAGSMMEHLTIDVKIQAFKGGDEAQAVYERCCDLIDIVRTVVRTDPTISGTVPDSWPSGFDAVPSIDEGGQGRWCTADGQITTYVLS
jgi:hypothetical protein